MNLKRYLFNAFNALVMTMALMFVWATSAMAADAICGTPQVQTLFAGQTIDVGSVTVSNDANNLYVTYTTTNGWYLQGVHLYVLTSAPTSRLPPGQAPYKAVNLNATTYTLTVPLPGGTTCGETMLWLQAHADVVKIVGGVVVDAQTAYGGPITVPDQGAWYGNISYVVQCCQTTGNPCTDTNTAFGGNSIGPNWQPWWYYYDTSVGGTQPIWAGQTINVGTVNVSCSGTSCSITMMMTSNWGLVNDPQSESVKIQGYNTLPNSRPIAGQFTTYKGTDLNVTVDYYPYYVIHLDVGIPAGCTPPPTSNTKFFVFDSGEGA